MRIRIGIKLLVFALVLALIPLGIAGRVLIQITRDELKSSANEELSYVAQELAREIDARYQEAWRTPLQLIADAVDSPELGPVEKISLLTSGARSFSDIVSLQISVEGVTPPVIVSQDQFAQRLREAQLDPAAVLAVPWEELARLVQQAGELSETPRYLEELDSWLLVLALDLEQPIRGRNALMAAQVSLNRLREEVRSHPYNRTGSVYLVNNSGQRVFSPQGGELSAQPNVREAVLQLQSKARSTLVQPYTKPDGSGMLSAVAFPASVDWAVIVEENEAHAYAAVRKMSASLLQWIAIGLLVAVVVAIFGSRGLSRPIVRLGRVAQVVGTGDLQVTVDRRTLRLQDEIGDLGREINAMIRGLRERFELTKFVSAGTVTAIQKGGLEGVHPGGERRLATVLFTDIRSFTSYAERVEPELVIEMLNIFLSRQADVVREYGGDVDKYVGDELFAIFQGPDMVPQAVRCAVAIQESIAALNAQRPQWDLGVGIGINTGEMVMGAMGSRERMDYTIIGDHVNIGERLCAIAGRGQILISEFARDHITGMEGLQMVSLGSVRVKGRSDEVEHFEVRANSGKGGGA